MEVQAGGFLWKLKLSLNPIKSLIIKLVIYILVRRQLMLQAVEKDVRNKAKTSFVRKCLRGWREVIQRKKTAVQFHNQQLMKQTFSDWHYKAVRQMKERLATKEEQVCYKILVVLFIFWLYWISIFLPDWVVWNTIRLPKKIMLSSQETLQRLKCWPINLIYWHIEKRNNSFFLFFVENLANKR